MPTKSVRSAVVLLHVLDSDNVRRVFEHVAEDSDLSGLGKPPLDAPVVAAVVCRCGGGEGHEDDANDYGATDIFLPDAP